MKQKDLSIAVLSGKGGAGKTLAAVNLASVCSNSTYVDCDVEEPNGHLFFKPDKVNAKAVAIKIPQIDHNKCDSCRVCVEFCKFNALALVNKKVKIFENICHSCGGCMILCPQKAIKEKEKIIGEIREGIANGVKVISGIMIPGVESGTSIVRETLKIKPSGTVIIDCPPGSSCLVMESLKDADFCLLVAEPTIFGRHNLEMVHRLLGLFNKKHGVLLNKSLEYDNPSEQFCLDNNIPILGHLAFDPELGNLNSRGVIAARYNEKYKSLFESLYARIKLEALK